MKLVYELTREPNEVDSTVKLCDEGNKALLRCIFIAIGITAKIKGFKFYLAYPIIWILTRKLERKVDYDEETKKLVCSYEYPWLMKALTDSKYEKEDATIRASSFEEIEKHKEELLESAKHTA